MKYDIDRLNACQTFYGFIASCPGDDLHADLDRIDRRTGIDTRNGTRPNYFRSNAARNPVGRRIQMHEDHIAWTEMSNPTDGDYTFWLGAEGENVSG